MLFYKKKRRQRGKKGRGRESIFSTSRNDSLKLARLFSPRKHRHDAASHDERVCSVTLLRREHREEG